MKVNVQALEELAENEKWSIPELAAQLGIDYSYLFRVMKQEKNGGGKLFNGIYHLCKSKELDVEKFIFLPTPLFVNNSKQTTERGESNE